jgi:site-specific DNA-methyltransferase (adenine-specific)
VKPYYQDDAVTIYHGDCREIVPTLGRFNLLLTDPPYGIGKDGQNKTTGGHGGRKAYDFLGWDDKRPPVWLIQMILDACDDYVIWGGNYFSDFLPPCLKPLVWDKGQRINQSDGEIAYTSLDGALRIYILNRVALMQDGAEHPTQKPLELIAWCLSFFPGAQNVLDPFAGSGTTGRACKDLGRKCTLIEREERYCEIAAKRMAQEVLPLGTA